MRTSKTLPSPVLHRAFLLAAGLLLAVAAPAQADKFGQPMDKAASGKADQAEGARILTDAPETWKKAAEVLTVGLSATQ